MVTLIFKDLYSDENFDILSKEFDIDIKIGDPRDDDLFEHSQKYEKLYKTLHAVEDKIKYYSSRVSDSKDYFSEDAQGLISLCIWAVIELAPVLRVCQDEYEILAKERWSDWVQADGLLGDKFMALTRLAIIYEKRKEYDFAINACEYAIENGFLSDGSKGMKYRLDRLRNKSVTNPNGLKKLINGK
jgi:hypothetical protein